MIVACIGYFVLDIFVDGVFHDPFAKTVVYIFERIGMDELEAIRVYRLIFVQNKTMIIGAGFFVLLLLSFYLGMSKFTTYLRQVEGGIQMILNESKDRILLPPELNPLENKLNEITVRNYGFTVEDSCGMFILWFGEDFEKNKAEAVHLLKRSLQKENKFRVCILPLEVWQEIFVIVYQTAEFEMAEQYFQENIVPILCSNLNGDVVCV